MEIKLNTAPAFYPLSLEDVKEHLNITGAADDGYIDVLIAAAVNHIEQITKRRLITQTWIAYFDEWPNKDRIRLPFGQLQSVTSVMYTDSDQAANTMTASEYVVNIVSEPGAVVLDFGDSWPTDTLHPSSPIYIEFVCGYTSQELVPPAIKHAIKLSISNMWENRETFTVGTIIQETDTINQLLMPHIVESVYP